MQNFEQLYLGSHWAEGKRRIEGYNVYFIEECPNYWEGYIINRIPNTFVQHSSPIVKKTFQMRRDNLTQKYIVEYFNTNQHAIAIPLNELQDVISVLDVSIKLGVKYKNP